jgi:hypothetical protein
MRSPITALFSLLLRSISELTASTTSFESHPFWTRRLTHVITKPPATFGGVGRDHRPLPGRLGHIWYEQQHFSWCVQLDGDGLNQIARIEYDNAPYRSPLGQMVSSLDILPKR